MTTRDSLGGAVSGYRKGWTKIRRPPAAVATFRTKNTIRTVVGSNTTDLTPIADTNPEMHDA
jgi:hypothetical protein